MGSMSLLTRNKVSLEKSNELLTGRGHQFKKSSIKPTGAIGSRHRKKNVYFVTMI